jgi:uncharacterized protein involved in exopolysaccharide biosynthesis
MREAVASRPDEIRPVTDQFVDPEPLGGLALIAFLLKGWRTIAIATAVIGGLFFLKTALAPRTYTVGTSLMPDARGATPGVGGLAAQLGIPVSGGDPTQSPQFYLELLTSDAILRAVANAHYTFPGQGNERPKTLAEYYGIKSSPHTTDDVIKRLRSRINPSVSLRTGVISASVTANDPGVAFQLANAIIDELNRFNTDRRRSRAGAEKEFAERRLAETNAALRSAEDRLQGFLQTNREFRSSVGLTLEQDRLSRDVVMRQELFTAAAQAYEQAKMEQVRDTPVLTVLEPPRVPTTPDRRGLIKTTAVGIIFGAILGVMILLLKAPYQTVRVMVSQDTALPAIR